MPRPPKDPDPTVHPAPTPASGSPEPRRAIVRGGSNPLAAISLVCSLVFLCPITTFLGPVIGLFALLSTREDPARRGRGMAVAGIVIGTVFSLMWGAIMVMYVAEMRRAQFRMIALPTEALEFGTEGDVDAFQARFTPDGAELPDEVAAAFLDALGDRYGEFQPEPTRTHTPEGGEAGTVEFELVFEAASPRAVLVFHIEPGVRNFSETVRIESLEIVDPERGNLRYPPRESGSDAGSAPTEPDDANSPE